MMLRPFGPFVGALVWITLATGIAAAQQDGKSSVSPAAPPTLSGPVFDTTTPVYNPPNVEKAADTVVASVDGRTITLGEVADAIRDFPPSMQNMEYSDLFGIARTQLIAKLAVAMQASKEGLADDRIVRRRIQAASNNILAEAYVRRQAAKDITEHELLERYARDIAGKPGPDELHLRVIVVATLEEARDVIRQLEAGADFATLARRVSKDESAPQGGDLGFMSSSILNPELAAAGLVIPRGQVSASPIASAGNWFVLKVEDRRAGAALPFAAVRDQIERQIIHEKAAAVSEKVLAQAIIRVFSIDGQEVQTLPTELRSKAP